MTSYTNEIAIKHAGGLSYLQIRNASADEQVSGNSYDVEVYKANDIYPKKKDVTFAGWYSDANYSTPYTGTTGKAYAKFIDADVLKVMFQWKESDHSALRFVSTIDHENYQTVGFIFSGKYGDKTIDTKDKEISTVYKKIEANNQMISPTTVFASISKYFFTYTIRNMNGNTASNWTVTPYFVTPDGTKVLGTTGTHSYTP